MLALGNRKDALAFKRAIDHKVNLSPIVSNLFTEDFKLNDWLDRESVPPPLLGASRKGAVAIRQAVYAGGTVAGATIMKPQPIMEALLIPVADKDHAQQRGMSQQLSQEETLLSQTKIMTIGRQVGAYLLIDNDSVSRRHAEISFANKQYVLRDLGSSNGTFVNETRLEADKVYILKTNDQIRFGKVKFMFQVQGFKQAEGAMTLLRSESLPGITTLHELTTGFFDLDERDKSSPYTPSGQPVLNADGSLLLPGATQALPADIVATFKEDPALIVLVHGSPQIVYLKQGRSIILGRDKACDVVIADVAASRKHAEVFPGPDGSYIRDLGSANGVIVNQMKIDNPYLLVHGDRITIGGIVIFFMNIQQGGREEQSYIVGAGLAPALNAPALNAPALNAPALAACRNCGASNTGIARFCTTCGAPLENSQAAIKG
jgi:pSer/pThr/pTyr-binding forkhead associated (FHA) protein